MDIVDEIFGMFERFGDLAYGEDVTQREHALQAAHFAVQDDAPDALVAAALIHDVGQFIEQAGDAAESEGRDARHEHLGGDYLARFFPPEVVEPIRLHVDAKRYLCAAEPGYLEKLSAASSLSLSLQGGPFTLDEMAEFRGRPHAAEAVRLRRYDDLGKQRDLVVAPLESYRALLESLRL
jgi:[1-hydroxy-2-(trimethylamino)ethyl]phosphonate dioxygenase